MGFSHVGPAQSLTFSRVCPKGCHEMYETFFLLLSETPRKILTVGTKVDGSLEEDFPDEPSVGAFLGSTSSFSGYIYQH